MKTLDELITKYDEVATHTQFGAAFYREEIHRRDQEEATGRVARLTFWITVMTCVMTVATIVNVWLFAQG